jgi:hypothetical protein
MEQQELMNKKLTTIYIEENLLKQAKHHCINDNISFTDLIANLLTKHLNKITKNEDNK